MVEGVNDGVGVTMGVYPDERVWDDEEAIFVFVVEETITEEAVGTIADDDKTRGVDTTTLLDDGVDRGVPDREVTVVVFVVVEAALVIFVAVLLSGFLNRVNFNLGGGPLVVVVAAALDRTEDNVPDIIIFTDSEDDDEDDDVY